MNNFDDLITAGGEKKETKSERSYNKEEWAAKKQQERTDAFELLDTATKEAVENCETFRDYLLVQSRFGRYSVSNALLIAYQNNEATYLADFETWKEKGVFVQRGEKAITLLEPGNEFKDGGQYVTSVKDDLIITEYNADRILEGSLKILITRDGESVDVDFSSNPETINAQVGIGESGWYQYVYTIKSSNFEKDGVYKIALTSKYAADDSAENESTSVPDNSIDSQGKEIVDSMNFTVDSVAPEIRNIVNLDKRIADRDKIVDGKLNVKYTVVDVGGLKSIEIAVNGKTIQTLTEKEIADNAYNFTGSFDIDEQDSTTAQKVRIKVTDLAGNVTDTDSDDFLKEHSADNENSTYVFFNKVTVSRNFFVRWYANTALFWGSIGGVIVLAAAIWFLVTSKRKKNKEK